MRIYDIRTDKPLPEDFSHPNDQILTLLWWRAHAPRDQLCTWLVQWSLDHWRLWDDPLWIRFAAGDTFVGADLLALADGRPIVSGDWGRDLEPVLRFAYDHGLPVAVTTRGEPAASPRRRPRSTTLI